MAKDVAADIRALIRKKYAIAERGDYFQLLGVGRTAAPGQIKQAYFNLVKQLHPDRLTQHGIHDMRDQATKLFNVLTQAYDTLCDPARRQEYVAGNTAAATPERPAMKAATQSNEEAAKIAYHKGTVMMNKRSYTEAEKLFRQAAEAKPDIARYWDSLGWAVFSNPDRDEEKRVENARKCFERALDVDKEDPQTHYHVGLYWKAKDNPARTKRAMEKALEFKPEFIEAKRELRLLEMRQKKKKEERRRTPTNSGLLSRFFGSKPKKGR